MSNEAAGMRINVRAGTYASTTTTRTLAATGTTTAPIWWRGFNTTIGDIDTDQTLTKPALTFTTGGLTISGAHHIVSNLDISGARTTGQVVLSGAACRVHRVRSENTNAAAGSRAITLSAANNLASACWFKATSSATSVVNATVGGHFRECVIVGGGNGIDCAAVASYSVVGCVILSPGGDGISVNTNAPTFVMFDHNTIYGASGDGIEFATVPAGASVVTNNLISNCGGWGILNSSGANTNFLWRSNNSFYLNTSGNESGFGDSPSLAEALESGSPFTNAGSGDFSLASGASSRTKAAPYPGTFENRSFTGYRDIGGVQHADPVGGGVAGSRIFGGF